MTPRRRRQTPPLTAMMRFLLEEFIDVTDDDEAFASEAAAKALARFRARSARVFLPGPKQGAFSRQQLALRDIPPAEFQQLRRDVGDWLRSLVISSGVRNRVRRQVSLSLVSVPGRPDHFQAPIVEGQPRDVFWYYLVGCVSRAGLARIGVCPAPKSRRDFPVKAESCERLFLRRGHAKAYCSDRCRARVATQRARG